MTDKVQHSTFRFVIGQLIILLAYSANAFTSFFFSPLIENTNQTRVSWNNTYLPQVFVHMTGHRFASSFKDSGRSIGRSRTHQEGLWYLQWLQQAVWWCNNNWLGFGVVTHCCVFLERVYRISAVYPFIRSPTTFNEMNVSVNEMDEIIACRM